MYLMHVPPTHIDQAWRDGASMLAEACNTSGGEVTGDQLKMLLSRNERILFAAMKDAKPVGWCVVRIDNLPNVRVMHICEVYAPGNLDQEYVDQLSEIAKKEGCSELRCSAKPAQSRLYQMRFKFEPIYETLRVKL